MQQKNKIALRNVSRVFTSAMGEKIEALRDVNLEVEDEFAPDGRDIGEFRVLLGPSGCGKSTILRLIAGLDFPTSGEVLMNGARVTGPGSDRGMVFQKYTSFAWLTVAGNIEYGLSIKGTPPAERKEIVGHLIEAVGLRGFENAYPHTLSGGMQQRVAIARSLAVRPQVLLMDEPFGALDAQTRNEMQDLLLRIWDETAATVLFVTHDVAEAVFLADRMYIVSSRPGTIAEEIPVPFGRPRDQSLKERPEFQEVEAHALARLRRAGGAGQVRVSV
ncbi:ABC transporter ATP-binding protein [uncultured Paludibaculum sp.]|uniref:ABC transporter ATP-binding protein n=1 Tax=uncultured Paludibaculum sp. TaxID=1765020 RepID=UPI002AAA6BB8|nr:ABC transporter ATP-binding protein [uncultured Paludibaculum sp.]